MALWGNWNRKHPRAMLAVEALRRYEDSLCGCGHSALLTWDRHELTGEVRVTEYVCIACEARENVAKHDTAENVAPGSKRVVRMFPEGVPDVAAV